MLKGEKFDAFTLMWFNDFKVTTYGYMLSSYFKCIKTKIKLVMVFCYVLCQ